MPSLQNQRYARFTCTSRQISRSERIAKTYPTTSIRIISSPDRSTGGLWMNSGAQAHHEARIDRVRRRSFAPDDLQVPHRQTETPRTAGLGHSSDGPSWIDSTVIRVNATESRSKPVSNDFCNKIGTKRK